MTDGHDQRSQRARILAGDLYIADDPELLAASRRARQLEDRYNRSAAEHPDALRAILVELLGSVGPDTYLRPPFRCDYGSNLHLGARVFANCGLVALDVATITIGDDAQIGPNVQLLTPTHPLDPELRRAKWEAAEPITIGANVWLGGGVIVLPGVSIGDNAVVGAGRRHPRRAGGRRRGRQPGAPAQRPVGGAGAAQPGLPPGVPRGARTRPDEGGR